MWNGLGPKVVGEYYVGEYFVGESRAFDTEWGRDKERGKGLFRNERNMEV
jgi:hypothetical protein